MIRMTIATDAHGNVLGAIQHPNGADKQDFQAGVSFGPGTQLRVIDVPADLALDKVRDVGKFQDALREHALKAPAH